MNINAQELSILRKNMKFGEAQPTATTSPVAEPPVSKPESGLNALEAQAQNNIAFQGVHLPVAMRKGMGKVMLMTALLAGAGLMTTSCQDDKPYVVQPNNTTIINNVNVDVSAWAAIFQQMLDQQKITNEQLILLNTKMTELMAMVADGQLKAEDFYKEMYSFMTTVIANQESIEATLEAQGKTQEEIKNILAEIDQLAKDGKYKEALEKIYNILLGIDSTVKDILTEVKGLRDDINKNHEAYMAAREEEIELLSNIYEDGKIRTGYVADSNTYLKAMEEYLEALNINVNNLNEIFNDADKYNKFMEDIKAMLPSDIDYSKFEAMFNALGLTMEDVINMSRKDILGAINGFQNDYLAKEEAQLEQLVQINAKLSVLENIPNLNLGDLQAAVEALNKAVQAGSEDVADEIKAIQAQIDAVLAKLDKLIDNTSGLTEYFDGQQINWINALKNMEKGNQILDKILTEQKVTNEKLDGFKKDFDAMKENQKTANSYLNILVNKAGDLENAIKDLDTQGGAGMTRDEFISAMAERDAKVAEAFKKFLSDYGFDKMPGDVQTIKELLSDVKGAIANQKDYSAQLDKIIGLESDIYNFLKTMDFSDPAQVAKLDKIITLLENWKCNCDCGASSDNNDESIKDLEDLFGKN